MSPLGPPQVVPDRGARIGAAEEEAAGLRRQVPLRQDRPRHDPPFCHSPAPGRQRSGRSSDDDVLARVDRRRGPAERLRQPRRPRSGTRCARRVRTSVDELAGRRARSRRSSPRRPEHGRTRWSPAPKNPRADHGRAVEHRDDAQVSAPLEHPPLPAPRAGREDRREAEQRHEQQRREQRDAEEAAEAAAPERVARSAARAAARRRPRTATGTPHAGGRRRVPFGSVGHGGSVDPAALRRDRVRPGRAEDPRTSGPRPRSRVGCRDRVAHPRRDRGDAARRAVRRRACSSASPRDAAVGINLLELDRIAHDMIRRARRGELLHRLPPVVRRDAVRQGALHLGERRGAARPPPRLRAAGRRPASASTSRRASTAGSPTAPSRVIVGTPRPEDERLIATTRDGARRGDRRGRAPATGSATSPPRSATSCHAAGYSVNLEFGGHGVGRTMHGDPHVPNDGRAAPRAASCGPGLVLRDRAVAARDDGPDLHRPGRLDAPQPRRLARRPLASTPSRSPTDGPIVLTARVTLDPRVCGTLDARRPAERPRGRRAEQVGPHARVRSSCCSWRQARDRRRDRRSRAPAAPRARATTAGFV